MNLSARAWAFKHSSAALKAWLWVIASSVRLILDCLNRTEERDEHLVIHIGDNGPGMEEDLVRRILAGQVEARGSGIGIKNIRERLKQFYGDDFSLDIDSMQGRGTTVTITVAKLEPAEAMEG